MAKYYETVAEAIMKQQQQFIDTQIENFEKAALLMTESWKNKKNVWIFSGAAGDIITQELHFRAGGFATMNPVFTNNSYFKFSSIRPVPLMWEIEKLPNIIRFIWQNIPFEKGDTVILNSFAGANAMMVEAVEVCKELGMNSIAITDIALSKQCTTSALNGKKLYEVADVVIDLCGADTLGKVQVKNGEYICSGDLVLGVMSAQSLVAAAATEMIKQGCDAPILRSVNKEGAAVYNSALMQKYKSQIHYPFMQGKYTSYYQVKG